MVLQFHHILIRFWGAIHTHKYNFAYLYVSLHTSLKVPQLEFSLYFHFSFSLPWLFPGFSLSKVTALFAISNFTYVQIFCYVRIFLFTYFSFYVLIFILHTYVCFLCFTFLELDVHQLTDEETSKVLIINYNF